MKINYKTRKIKGLCYVEYVLDKKDNRNKKVAKIMFDNN